jgi:hypothetical protein
MEVRKKRPRGFKKEAQGVQVSPLNPYLFLPVTHPTTGRPSFLDNEELLIVPTKYHKQHSQSAAATLRRDVLDKYVDLRMAFLNVAGLRPGHARAESTMYRTSFAIFSLCIKV